ncbi:MULTISPECIES: DUF4224 domain-containing protein [Pseudomonas]|uniref:DUF4224 domain-containing protein n=1 Tax=Pseudomonas TaxID=286 RepID=UPI001BCBD32F|nr:MULTISPECIES: DUF4224 domain-containing protein [Pseudomonas]MBS7600496.1 DUF4224 domain-containing protein [Pseudomonas sp. RC2C2]UVL26255.1 DUF4224 domain-containing protein [Pseudomonas donghuensis]
MKETKPVIISSAFNHSPVTHLGELLTEDELASITGYQTPSRQIQWLSSNGWQHLLNGARRPVVGRLYARLKLAGLKPSEANAVTETWTFDLSRVN